MVNRRGGGRGSRTDAVPHLLEFAREHTLKIISIEDLIVYRMRREKLVRCVSERHVRIRQREARVKVYGTDFDQMQHVAFVFGDVEGQDNVIARIHREEPIRDVTDGDWFETAFCEIEPVGRGLMRLLRAPQVEGETQGCSQQRARTSLPAKGMRAPTAAENDGRKLASLPRSCVISR